MLYSKKIMITNFNWVSTNAYLFLLILYKKFRFFGCFHLKIAFVAGQRPAKAGTYYPSNFTKVLT